MFRKQTLLLVVTVVLMGCSSVNGPKQNISVLGNKYRRYVGAVRNLDLTFGYCYGCWEVVHFYSEDSLLMYYTNEQHNWQPIDSVCYNYSKDEDRIVPYWYEVNYPYITIEWNYVRENQPKSTSTPFTIINDTTIFASTGIFTKF